MDMDLKIHLAAVWGTSLEATVTVKASDHVGTDWDGDRGDG